MFNSGKCLYFINYSSNFTFRFSRVGVVEEQKINTYFSSNGGSTWTQIELGKWYSVPKNTRVYLKGTEYTCTTQMIIDSPLPDLKVSYKMLVTTFESSERVIFGGNISSLVDDGAGEDLIAEPWPQQFEETETKNYGFCGLFIGSKIEISPNLNVKNISELVESNLMYSSLFSGCTLLRAISYAGNQWGETGFQNWVNEIPERGKLYCTPDVDTSKGISDLPPGWLTIRSGPRSTTFLKKIRMGRLN